MSNNHPEKELENIPDNPGVYFFKAKGEILYIGKATSLRDRVRSYFRGDLMESRGPLIQKMIGEIENIEWEITGSVLEALILESNLIKKHQPTYNTREKDNKSYNYVVFTDEDYPRIFTLRGRQLQTQYDPDDFKYTFGPYPSGSQLQEALKIIRRIFPFRGKKDPVAKNPRRSRLNEQMGLTPKFGSQDISVRQYSNTIQNLRLFFEGRKGKLVKKLKREMKLAAKEEQFETAEELKRQVFALEHINDVALLEADKTDVVSGFRIEAYDIAHLGGKEMVGAMVVIEDGYAQKGEYRKFNIKTVKSSNDTAALKEVLKRRFRHDEWSYPKLIVVDGGKAQINVARKVLDEAGFQIPIVSVVKDERHQPRDILVADKSHNKYIDEYKKDILIANSEAHRFATSFHKEKRRKRFGG